jgi:hypothetical protein
MNVLDYFSATTDEADEKFRRACDAAGVETVFYKNPKLGPAGEDLHIGMCRIGPKNADNVLLILSGTHGVEGYAGAGIQTGALHQLADFNIAEDTAIVMVHLLNPWGVAWNRRENEDNVDIFRNLLYCDNPSESDPVYDLVSPVVNPTSWSKETRRLRSEMYKALAAYLGPNKITEAVRRGQHHNPQGQTYHGNGPTWSKLTLDAIIDTELSGAKKIAIIDIHTGFGDYGEGMVCSYNMPGSPKYERTMNWVRGPKYYPGEDPNIPSHQTIFPFDFIEDRVGGAEVTAVVLEYGTVPPTTTPHIWAGNLYYHLHGDPLSEEGVALGKEYRAFCYQENDDWKDAVYARGIEVIQDVLDGLNDWANHNAQQS